MNILLAVDGSEHSLAAVSGLIRHAARWKESPVVYLTYVHLPVPGIGGLLGGGPSKDVLDKYYREEGETGLAKAKILLDSAKLSYVEAILVGPTADTICNEAIKRECDMIWMGTRGLGAAASFVVGSVATKVLHGANVPVVLVK
ncbi:MAG: universal stress protein [Betaproteobacteria bacterium]